MNLRITIAYVLPALLSFLLSQWTVGQESNVRQGGCVALDVTSPPLFISYERRDEQAWDGRNYVSGVLLRLNNNSNCVISLTTPPGYPRELPPTFGYKNGKRVRLPDARIGSIKSGTKVSLYYLTKYPVDASLVFTGDFHVRDSIYLNNGDYIFFSVPLKNFKRNGRVLVPFTYDWDNGKPALVLNTDGTFDEAVEHYLTFGPERLPKDLLK